jgi:hypothetical protein
MLPMTIARGSTEDRNDDLRPEFPDDPHHILQDLVPRPVLPGLINALGVPEVIGSREVLMGSVEPARGKQLFGPDQPERFTQLRADEILASLAPVE